MIALTLSKLEKSYGTNVVLRNIELTVQGRERIGFVGANGTGKSTLFRILAGEIPPSSGTFSVNKQLRRGYLRQEKTADMAGEDGDNTVLSAARAAFHRLTAEGLELFESEIRGVLIGLGFSEGDFSKPTTALSGGERARLEIALLLLGKPDILLLDEPTNHLDLSGLTWLENRIRNFRGTVLLISHDRYFLDRTVTRICELDAGNLFSYGGGFENYRAQKRANLEAAAKAWEKEVSEYRRQEEMIRRFKQHGTEKLAKRAASREKMLERKGEPTPPPKTGATAVAKIGFAPARRSGDDVLMAEGLSKSFSGRERPLFQNASLEVKRGEKICLIGANGIGKTTLLKILAGRMDADDGIVTPGIKVNIGYYDQHQEGLCQENSLLEEMRDALPHLPDTELRGLLGRFLFREDKVFQEISSLSGGEKARLALLKLIVSGANTLLLDEPTNHLDIPSMEAIEEALLHFDGTLFIVSHDRYLLKRIPSRILELTADGLTSTIGAFQDYLEKKALLAGEIAADEGKGRRERALSPAAARYRQAKEAEASRRKRERHLQRTEDAIMTLEEEIEDLKSRQLAEETASDYELLARLHTEIEEKEAALSELLSHWESLADDDYSP